jgi:hypothetical protein
VRGVCLCDSKYKGDSCSILAADYDKYANLATNITNNIVKNELNGDDIDTFMIMAKQLGEMEVL